MSWVGGVVGGRGGTERSRPHPDHWRRRHRPPPRGPSGTHIVKLTPATTAACCAGCRSERGVGAGRLNGHARAICWVSYYVPRHSRRCPGASPGDTAPPSPLRSPCRHSAAGGGRAGAAQPQARHGPGVWRGVCGGREAAGGRLQGAKQLPALIARALRRRGRRVHGPQQGARRAGRAGEPPSPASRLFSAPLTPLRHFLRRWMTLRDWGGSYSASMAQEEAWRGAGGSGPSLSWRACWSTL